MLIINLYYFIYSTLNIINVTSKIALNSVISTKGKFLELSYLPNETNDNIRKNRVKEHYKIQFISN